MSARPNLAARLTTAVAPPTPAAVKAQAAPASKASSPAIVAETPVTSIAKARQGKTMVAGYYSQDFARAVKMLAVERGLSVQALIGEGLDLLLREHGKHPFGER